MNIKSIQFCWHVGFTSGENKTSSTVRFVHEMFFSASILTWLSWWIHRHVVVKTKTERTLSNMLESWHAWSSELNKTQNIWKGYKQATVNYGEGQQVRMNGCCPFQRNYQGLNIKCLSEIKVTPHTKTNIDFIPITTKKHR